MEDTLQSDKDSIYLYDPHTKLFINAIPKEFVQFVCTNDCYSEFAPPIPPTESNMYPRFDGGGWELVPSERAELAAIKRQCMIAIDSITGDGVDCSMTFVEGTLLPFLYAEAIAFITSSHEGPLIALYSQLYQISKLELAHHVVEKFTDTIRQHQHDIEIAIKLRMQLDTISDVDQAFTFMIELLNRRDAQGITHDQI